MIITSLYREKVFLRLLCGVHSVIMADFIMPETQQPTCTYSYYFDYLLTLPFKRLCRTLGFFFK